MKHLTAILMVVALLGGACSSSISRTERFNEPDIKNEFCGVRMDYRYCKCAFHGEFCEAIGKSKGEANRYVQDEYAKWVDTLKQEFGAKCAADNGAYDGDDRCDYCESGFVAHDGDCVKPEEIQPEPETDAVVTAEPQLLDAYCELDYDIFNAEWKKYSDIDSRIAFEERSWEAQQAVAAYDDMIAAMVAGFAAERDLEIERQILAELQVYKQALVQDLKTNLLKSFWRLAWMTYSTVDSGRGLGGSAATLITEELAATSLGAGLKVVQGTIPNDAALAFDTSTEAGLAKSVGASTALEAIDSLGDPVKVATEFLRGATMAALPTADLTADEIAILKQQHQSNGAIDVAISQSEVEIARLQAFISETEQDIERFRAEADEWESKEKTRVAASLKDGCRQQKASQ